MFVMSGDRCPGSGRTAAEERRPPGRSLDTGGARADHPAAVITLYIDKALHRARYAEVDPGVYCATVPGLRGVIATGATLEACRDALAEVVEEWVLVRVARGVSVPSLGGVTVAVKSVKKAS
jgi:predicted RNase H-like HicB family nuclease